LPDDVAVDKYAVVHGVPPAGKISLDTAGLARIPGEVRRCVKA
jgi:hypothetical protein